MSCKFPIRGYRSKAGRSENGSWPVVFNIHDGYKDLPIEVPCGRCISCRLERSRQWAIRCINESQMYDDNCFITLTYNDEHIPRNGSLKVKDFQKFMKRLRKKYGPDVRFFHCGEYGEKYNRPHYHAIIFNHDFSDKYYWRNSKGNKLYRSEELEKLWKLGNSEIGEVTFESAAYVARYCVKKISGPKAEEHYGKRKKEYCTMSRRPGIGRPWLDKYQGDLYPEGRMIVRHGLVCRTPRYYDEIYDVVEPEKSEQLKRERRCYSQINKKTPEELEVENKVQELRAKKLVRNLERTL